MLRVRLITDPFNLAEYSEHETDALIPFLQGQFTTWPETARLYRDAVATQNDITPRTEDDIAALDTADDGLFYVVVYPGDPVTAIITTVAVLALTAAVLLFLTPKLPTGQDDQSSNNSLGARSNKARPNGRIEDIFGEVISVPTLLTVPLLVFDNQLEVEYCYMAVGRGDHVISDVKDGDTPINQIAGAGVRFYGPNTSPNSGAPFYSIGAPITQPLLDVIRQNEVNGQALRSPNSNSVSGSEDIRFVAPDTIERQGNAIDFTEFFDAGDEITVSTGTVEGAAGGEAVTVSARFTQAGVIELASFDPTALFTPGMTIQVTNAGYAASVGSGVLYVDLTGIYVIAAVDSDSITLTDPASINTDWTKLGDYPNDRTEYRDVSIAPPINSDGINLSGTYQALAVTAGSITFADPAAVNPAWNNIDGATEYVSPTLSTQGERWVGPFTIDMPALTQVVANFTAPQGMYRVTKKGKNRPASVQIQFEVTPVNDDDNPIGPAELFVTTLYGDGSDKKAKGVTLYANVSFVGRCRVRARRLTPTDNDTEDTIVDEVQWRDGYGTAPVDVPHFGNVTTVHSRTYATSGATSVKERKLNCRAARKVLVRNEDNTFGPALAASTNAADIICHMALDPFIGGRPLDELDVEQIYGTIADVQAYFGIPDAGTFSYTFDQDNISAEEMIQAVAQAVFCIGYRQGSILRLSFEREGDDPILLFNHRNKEPGSETRTVTFGNLNDHDGVELDYISSKDGATLTIYIPEDQSAVKAKKLEIIGVVDRRGDGAHPYLHAARAWNKIRYQNETTEFTSYGEASQLVNGQRIQVADNTSPDIDDGEVVSQDGLVLELSQPFTAEPDTDYFIFLQLPGDDTASPIVERLPCVAGDDDRHVVLSQAPSQPIVVDSDAWAQATYQIVKASDNGPELDFILTEKGPYDKKTVSVQAINYDPRYYADDQRYLP